MLENLRFDPGETENNPNFAKQWAKYAEVYINDAFGTAHRAHASTYGMVKYVDGTCGIGFLMKKELEALSELLNSPESPFIVIMGGAKVSDKIGLLKNLLQKSDKMLIGGAMAYAFLAAQGKEIGSTLVEKSQIKAAKEILESAQVRGVEVILPVDHVVASSPEDEEVSVSKTVPNGKIGFDIGPETRELFASEIAKAKKIFWNGPLGMFEKPQFSEGTKYIAESIAKQKVLSVVGGGDSASAVRKFGLDKQFHHVCTGGGAALKFLEGKELPAISALLEKLNKKPSGGLQ